MVRENRGLGCSPEMTSLVRLVPRASPHPTPPPEPSGPPTSLPSSDTQCPGSFPPSPVSDKSQFANADHSPAQGLPGLHKLGPPLTSLTWDHPPVGAAGVPDIFPVPMCPQHLAVSSPSQVCSWPPYLDLLLSLWLGPKWAFFREAFPWILSYVVSVPCTSVLPLLLRLQFK